MSKANNVISQTAIDLSEIIAKQMTVDESTGIVSVPDSLYETTLPSNITMENVNDVQKHNTNFIAAALHALGNIKQNSENSDNLKVVSFSSKMGATKTSDGGYTHGDDSLDMRINYTETSEGKIKPEFFIKYHTSAVGNTGDLAAIKKNIISNAMKQLDEVNA